MLLLLLLLLLVYCASRAYRAVPIKRNPTEPGDLVNFRKCYWLGVDSLTPRRVGSAVNMIDNQTIER